jgi:uncharacterized protein
MTAVDTNVLVYSHREESPWHEAASRCMQELAESGQPWAIPWPCIHEFLGIVTHPRIYTPPTPLELAFEQVKAWQASPTLLLLAEMAGYWPRLSQVLRTSQVVGPKVHDARIATLCAQHGVRVLWSADRDLSRFPGVSVVNPLVT